MTSQSKQPESKRVSFIDEESDHQCSTTHDMELTSDEQDSKLYRDMTWSRDNFEVTELMAEDAFVEVYKVRHRETDALAFLKISRKHYQYKSRYLSEEYIWRRASPHPNVVQLYSCFCTHDWKGYVFEYLSLGTLRNFIKVHKVLRTPVAALLSAQIASAVDFIHRRDIFLREVSNRHILLSADGQAKLSNFTHALMNETARGVHGNLFYQAPEVFSGQIYDMTADWWSLGVCMYEMVVGETPTEYHCRRNGIDFKELDYTGKIVVMLTTSVYIPEIFPKPLRSILGGLLEKEKELRLGYKENVTDIRGHEFFRDVDWEAVENGTMKVKLPSNGKPL